MLTNLLTLALCVCLCTGFVPSFAPKTPLSHAANDMNRRPAVVGMHMALKKVLDINFIQFELHNNKRRGIRRDFHVASK